MKKYTEEQMVKIMLDMSQNIGSIQSELVSIKLDLLNKPGNIEFNSLRQDVRHIRKEVDSIVATLAPKLEQLEDHEDRIGRLEHAT